MELLQTISHENKKEYFEFWFFILGLHWRGLTWSIIHKENSGCLALCLQLPSKVLATCENEGFIVTATHSEEDKNKVAVFCH